MSKSAINRNLPNDAYQGATNANDPSALNPFVTEKDAAKNSASLTLYPTDVVSPVNPSYNKLVNSITDPDFPVSPGFDLTATITVSNQLIASFASEEGVITGNPGNINVSTIGNIKRISGTGTYTFYFEVYHRTSGGTETLLGTSNITDEITNLIYEEFFVSASVSENLFGTTDRVVVKWYANRVPGGTDPDLQIKLGSDSPTKITFPLPFVNLPSPVDELNDLTDVTTNLPVSPTNADDGRLLYYDVTTSQWTSDDIANISNVVKDCKTSVGTGSIAKGVPVYLAGFDNDLLVVEPCNAASAATMPCIGITAEALDSTNPKKVVSFGKVQGVNTAAFTVGDILYVASGGGFTTTRPTGTALIQRVAVVLKADNPGGILKVINTSRTAGLPNLANGNVWQGNASGYPTEVPLPAAGHVIEDEGTPLTQRPTLDFQGAGVTVTDDAGNNQTVVTIPGGGGGGGWVFPFVDVSTGTAGQSAALVSIPIGTGAGHYRNFDGTSNDTWATVIPLYNNGIAYDGRNITIDVHWMPFGVVGAGDDVEWTVEYYFGRDGIDVFSQATTSVVTLIDITGRTSQLQYTDTIGTINGLAGDTQLHLIIRRNSQGATPDTYGGDVELYSITFR